MTNLCPEEISAPAADNVPPSDAHHPQHISPEPKLGNQEHTSNGTSKPGQIDLKIHAKDYASLVLSGRIISVSFCLPHKITYTVDEEQPWVSLTALIVLRLLIHSTELRSPFRDFGSLRLFPLPRL